MILSNLEIHKALDEGRLVIDPEPRPRTPQHGIYCPYNTHSVDLRLGHKIAVPRPGAFSYNLTRSASISQTISANSDIEVLASHRPFELEPGKFVLGETFEKVVLPTDKGQPYLAARIEGRSSRARVGLLVHFTAPTVHPGWNGH